MLLVFAMEQLDGAWSGDKGRTSSSDATWPAEHRFSASETPAPDTSRRVRAGLRYNYGMSLIPLYECDLVEAETRDVLRTLRLPLIPRIGETVALEPTKQGASARVYRVTNVRYEIANSQRVRLGHLGRVMVEVALSI